MSTTGRRNDVIRYLAVAKVEQLIIAGHTRINEIHAQLVRDNMADPDEHAWVLGLVREVLAAWQREDAEKRPYYRALWAMRLDERYRMMLDDLSDPTMKMTGAARAMLYGELAKVELLALKMHGLVQSSNKSGNPLGEAEFDIRKLSPDERRERISQLLAKRERTQKQLAAPPTKEPEPQGN